jgi:hypothetical protein
MEQILANVEFFQPFIPDIVSFTNSQRNSGMWATSECLTSLAHLAKRDYLLLKDTSEPAYVSNFFNDTSFPAIALSHEHGNHFTALFPITGEIKVGYPNDSPLTRYLLDNNLTLDFLKKSTNYNPDLRAAYPLFAGNLLQLSSRVERGFQRNDISKIPHTRQLFQTTLKFNPSKAPVKQFVDTLNWLFF